MRKYVADEREERESRYLIDSLYNPTVQPQKVQTTESRKSPKAKHNIFDEVEFSRGREVLGNLIVHGMMASGGTDIDWMVEHNGCFVIFEFKGFHNDKINIPLGQMVAYENLHQKLQQSSKCYIYIVGCDDIDFSNPDEPIWIFEMRQWKNGIIPKNTDESSGDSKKYTIYRDYMEEIKVEKLRDILDKHWKEFSN